MREILKIIKAQEAKIAQFYALRADGSVGVGGVGGGGAGVGGAGKLGANSSASVAKSQASGEAGKLAANPGGVAKSGAKSGAKFLPGSKELAQQLRRLLAACGLPLSDENFHAALMRVLALNTTLFKAACEREGIAEPAVRAQVDEFVKNFYEEHHAATIAQIAPLAGGFYAALLRLVDDIGRELNICAPKWLAKIEANAKFFAALDEPYEFIAEHGLVYKNERGEAADRVYALADGLEAGAPKLVAYAEYFAEEFAAIAGAFERFFAATAEHNDAEQLAWKDYLRALAAAMASREHSVAPWQAAEREWMKVRSAWQIGHFLEYYEDAFTHSVALEWDLRVNLQKGLSSEQFRQKITSAAKKIYKAAGGDATSPDAPKTMATVSENIARAQLYICTPALYYGAGLNGLFSAQVVPNDEAVSAACGKKIFAFVDFVYQKALKTPKTQLEDWVFAPEINAFNDAVRADEKLFKKVYEITTIGHEGGHIFFVAAGTETAMNARGMYKNIEEFKASAGGIYEFIASKNCPAKEALKPAVLANIACRAVRLLAYAREQEIEPYYCEALITLAILKRAGVVKFNDISEALTLSGRPPKSEASGETCAHLVDIDLSAFDAFAEQFKTVYEELARHYLRKLPAEKFLEKFAVKSGEKFISTDAQIAAAGEIYLELFAKFASKLKEEQ